MDGLRLRLLSLPLIYDSVPPGQFSAESGGRWVLPFSAWSPHEQFVFVLKHRTWHSPR